MFRRFFSVGTLLLPLALLSGCAYVHFGRIPPTDPALEQENTDLRLQKKMLQQELVIARKEGDALRATIDAGSGGADVAALTKRLSDAMRELNTLRASYARTAPEGNIRTPQGGTALIEGLKRQVVDAQASADQARRDADSLRADNDDLRKKLEAQKDENLALAAQVQDLGAEGSRLRNAVAQLNTELLAQKDARNQAEQAAAASKAELRTVLASQSQPAATPSQTSFGDLREGTASGVSSLDNATAPVAAVGADGATTVTFKSHAPARSDAAAAPAAADQTTKERTYVVMEGDTLELIAKKFYGTTERWNWIYAANNELLRGGRPIRPGMKLVIPDSSAIAP